ncbi:MAG: hypothetical protein ABS876_09480 [Ruminococcus sp.]
MAIDRADWHWDSTEKLYREKHQTKGALSEQQQREIWLLAGNHIGQFLRWVIENGFEGEEAEAEDCEKVRSGQMTGTEYLLHDCDGKFWEDDVREELLPFVTAYYDGGYFDDYAACCLNETDKPCYGVITDEADYQRLRARIEQAYAAFGIKNEP